MKWWSIAFVCVVCFSGSSRLSSAYAARNVFERASLKGLAAVQVVVENLAPDLTEDGLDRNQMKTIVERQLKRAGIPVEPRAENAFYIHLDTVKNEAGLYSYALSYQLVQLVLLFRDPSLVTWGTTWSLSQVGSIAPTDVNELEALITRGVHTFIEDYLAANEEAHASTPPSG